MDILLVEEEDATSEVEASNKRIRQQRPSSTRHTRRCASEISEVDGVEGDDGADGGAEIRNGCVKTSAVKPRRRVQGYDVKVPTDAGIAGQLLRVKLIQFMCHEHFEIYFGKHVNFVSGKNGSGKSAILQAIQLCFGTTANDTGRGKNVRGFIKTGCSYARIAVTVWNTGPEAYRKSDFGRVLTVERTFAQGTSRYSLITETGICLSNKRRDLDDMLISFGILCKNPMVVLTQGAASSFLRGRKLPADLYRLYMKATEFEEAAEEHKESYKQIQNQKQHINCVKTQLQEMLGHEADLVARVERAQEERIASECLTHAQNVLGFVRAEEKQEAVSLLEASLHTEEAAMTSLENEANEKRTELEKANKERESFNEEGQAAIVRQTLTRMRVEEGALKDQKRTAERECREPRKRITGLKLEIGQLELNKSSKEADLETLKNDDGEEVRAAKEEFTKEVQQKEEHIKSAETELQRCKQTHDDVSSAIASKEKTVKRMVDACDEHCADVRRLHGDLEQLRRVKGDPVTVFGGESIKSLLTAIHRCQGTFEREPIGPIGQYLSVRDEMWSLAIEFAIGNLFNAFIVHSFQDEEALRSLCRRMNIDVRFQLIVYPFDRAPYNIGSYEHPPHQTILKMLQVAEFESAHVIRNVLIDYGSAERVVVCPSEQEAIQIIRSGTSAFTPASVRLPTGRKVYKRRNAEVSMHDGRKLQPRLLKDISQQIRRTENELQRVKGVLQQKQHERKEQEQKYRSLTKEMEKVQTATSTAEQTLHRETVELRLLNERGPSLPAYAAFDIESLQEEIASVSALIKEAHNKVKEAEEELAFKEGQVKLAEQRIATHKAEFLNKKAYADQLSSELNDMLARCDAATTALERAEKAVESKRSRLETLKADEALLQIEIGNLRQRAREQCDEQHCEESMKALESYMPSPSSGSQLQSLNSEKLEAMIADFHRKIRNFRQHSNDRFEDLAVELEEVKQRTVQQSTAITNLEKLHAESEAGHKKRGELYRKNQTRMDATINRHFTRYMKKRAHYGTLKPNHKEQTVDIRVRMAGQDETVRDMASLSGGERSFTTVSLLLALASVVNSPFHCMDEFDVFTDAMTKYCAIQALIETAATEKTNSQFVFFSPQEVGTVEDVRRQINEKHMQNHPNEVLIPQDFVMIYQMAPPERQIGQTRQNGNNTHEDLPPQ